MLDAIHNGRARGNGQMAADLVEGEDAEDVAAYVAKAVGQSGEKYARDPATRAADSGSVRAVCHKSVCLQGLPPLLRCGAAEPLSSRKIRGAGDPGRWGESPFA